ncbi:hypothetical protein B0H21DRAFT_828877 [Amylocystis lapponica]|nr:hypothetical protein B0H21DRAFT_828877 [Amylocystis lapponica]
MPVYKNSDQKGNLYVMLEVDMPDEEWLKSIDRVALEAILPPKKPEMEPKPTVVDEVPFEESDIPDVPFHAGSHFFDHGFGAQFGDGDEGEWEDEDEDDDPLGEPECAHQ